MYLFIFYFYFYLFIYFCFGGGGGVQAKGARGEDLIDMASPVVAILTLHVHPTLGWGYLIVD